MRAGVSLSPKRILRLLQGLFILQTIRGGTLATSGDDPVYIVAGVFVARGLTPFLDFTFCHGPLLPYLYAPFAWLLGPSIIASRIFGVLCTLLLYGSCLWSAKRLLARENPGGDPGLALPIALTALFFIYPEMTAALSRIGSKEAVSSFCCVMAVASLSVVDARHRKNLIIAALFCAVSVGIRYTSGMIAVILLLFLSLDSIPDALRFGFLTACFILPIFLPFALRADGLEYLWQDFRMTRIAVLELTPGSTPGLVYHMRHTAWPTVHLLMRALFKYQLAFVPVLGALLWDLRQEGLRRVCAKGSFRLFATFLLLGTASCLLITPDMVRLNMFLPLLLVSAAIVFARLWLTVEDDPVSVPNFCRQHAGLCLALVGVLFSLNNTILFAFATNDTGLCDWTTWKDAVKRAPGADARAMLDILAQPDEEVLYVGPFQNDFVSNRYRLSPFSANGVQPYLAVRQYSIAEAERYHFLTEQLLFQMTETGRFRLVAWHSSLLDGWPAAWGVSSRRSQDALLSRYELVATIGVTAVFRRRS